MRWDDWCAPQSNANRHGATIPRQAISAQAYRLTTISTPPCLGMPLAEVIRSATAASAQALGQSDLGTVKPPARQAMRPS